MHLSTRWGKPSYEIEALPASEFQRQKIYWEAHSWGMQDDLAAMTASQLHAHRTHSTPTSARTIKEIAVDQCKYKPFVIEDAMSIRNATLPMFEEFDRSRRNG